MAHVSHTHWGTDSELGFISRLGQWSEVGESRAFLLAGYIRAMDVRVTWNGIDSELVRGIAQEALDKEGS